MKNPVGAIKKVMIVIIICMIHGIHANITVSDSTTGKRAQFDTKVSGTILTTGINAPTENILLKTPRALDTGGFGESPVIVKGGGVEVSCEALAHQIASLRLYLETASIPDPVVAGKVREQLTALERLLGKDCSGK